MIATRSEVMAIVRREIHVVKPGAPAELPDACSFSQDLGFDSLELAEYVARMEQIFRVTVPDEDWRSLSTPARVADYILARMSP